MKQGMLHIEIVPCFQTGPFSIYDSFQRDNSKTQIQIYPYPKKKKKRCLLSP